MSVFHPSLYDVHHLLQVACMRLGAPLEECCAFVFSDLQFGLSIGIEQIVDSLVVYLDISTLDLELYFSNLFGVEDVLVVKRLDWALRLKGFAELASVGVLTSDFLHLMKQVLKCSRQEAFGVFGALALDGECLA
jgi:hypothetical protein